MEEQNKTISDKQKLVANIEQTIEAVNEHLLNFGIKDFQIVKHKEAFEKIFEEAGYKDHHKKYMGSNQ